MSLLGVKGSNQIGNLAGLGLGNITQRAAQAEYNLRMSSLAQFAIDADDRAAAIAAKAKIARPGKIAWKRRKLRRKG